MNVRSKFIAHAVNDFEDVGVAASYVDDIDGPIVIAVADAYGAAILPNPYLLKWLGCLAKQARKFTEDRIDQLRSQIIEESNSLTKKQIQSLPSCSFKAGAYDMPSKRRR